MNFSLIGFLFVSFVDSQTFDTLQVIKKFGYKGESYGVETSDGYLLTIQRIVPNGVEKVKKLPCFLIHGVTESSLEYLQLQKDSLPFVLSNNGFDVYLGNSRGNQYSSHKKFHKNSSEFWDFGWHEIGVLDLPPMIDFVLNFTKSEKLFFIGFSQGATVGMVLLSMLPEYNRKIQQVHLAGPAVFMGHLPNPVLRDHGIFIVETFAEHNMVDLSSVVRTFRPYLHASCHKTKPLRMLTCIFLQYLVAGGNVYKYEADIDALRNFLDIYTPYASKKQLLHFMQLASSGKFQMFDYGSKNVAKYGSKNPPEYRLDQVDTQVYIYCAGQDGFTHKEDVELLRNKLPNIGNFRFIPNFNHYDFEGSRMAKQEVYLPMVKFMNSVGSNNVVQEAPQERLFSWISRFFKFK